MTRYFECVRSVFEYHGGTVEKFIGDAVMVVFGIPQVHEDDALRAVRAVAEMRTALTALNEQLYSELAIKLDVRAGVNSGEVVAGDWTSGQVLVTGDTVNVAARLEQAASPGDSLLGDETYRMVRDAVIAEPVEPLRLKGKSGSVRAYRLVEVKAGAPAHARRLDSPLVGRENELRLLDWAFERVVGEGGCHLVTVLGSAGVGKSRLVAEFAARNAPEARLLQGRCLPYGEGITFWPLAEVVKDAAGVSDDDSSDEACARVLALLAGEDEAESVASCVAQMINLSEATVGAEQSFWAVRKLLETVARRKPLILVFDDVHWAEPTFLDLIEHIADWSRDAPVLTICLARPELLDSRPGWSGGKLNATSILLEALSDQECGWIIENILGRAGLDDEVCERITAAAEGNPLFIEEMLSMLIDDGVLQRSGDCWIPVDDLSGVSIPQTIHVLLAARLERLNDEERQVIERAAVCGKVFYNGAVAELSSEALRPAVGKHLMTLIRKELVRADRSSFVGEEAFRFRHILVRDAAYNSIPKEARAEFHELFAAWLEKAAGDRVAEYEEVLGYHLEQAHRYRVELAPADTSTAGLARRAGERLASAGRRAYARHDTSAALNLLSRAVDLLRKEGVRSEVWCELGSALADAGEFARATTVFAEARDAAARTADDLAAAYARLGYLRSVDARRTGLSRVDDIRAEAGKYIQLMSERGDEHGLAAAYDLLADSYWMEAQAADALAAWEEAADHAQTAADTKLEQDARMMTGACMIFGPASVDQGLDRCRRRLGLAEGNPFNDAAVNHIRSHLEARKGNFEQARAFREKRRLMLQEAGQRIWLAQDLDCGADIEILAGRLDTADAYLREACRVLDDAGASSSLATASGRLCEVLYELGNYEEAAAFSRLCEENTTAGDVTAEVPWRGVRARLLAREKRFGEAEMLAREAVAAAAKSDFLEYQASALTHLAEVLRLAERPEEATAPAEEALRLYERKGNMVAAGRIRAALTG
jgi:AAA ATPase domain/Adenylate and Guanylate cyclase catalytic domain